MKDSTNILSLKHEEAKEFFLRESSFCNIELPRYFSFSSILEFLSTRSLDSIKTVNARKVEGANYTLVCNKDGKYAWRPLQIINPVIYVKLVNFITKQDNWDLLKKRFQEFQKDPNICCTSIPIYQTLNESTIPRQILNWWSEFEQKSIQLSIEYSHVFLTDITDCYGSIYTHSIAWAIHGKEFAKKHKSDHCLPGNSIDDFIEDMRFGQTNGISQGSILMDFIAEIVLGYVDLLLSEKMREKKIHNFKVLRYRDDYRIFVNEPTIGEEFLKELAIVLYSFGMRLNSSKTTMSSNIVLSSVKEDKREWLSLSSCFDNTTIQKKLLLILEHSIKYPNCGSLLQPLAVVYKELSDNNSCADTILAIVTEIAYRNPRTYQVCMALIAKIIHNKSSCEKEKIVGKILRKFESLTNTEYLNIWLQRIIYPAGIHLHYTGLLTNIVEGKATLPWSFEWVEDVSLRNIIKQQSILDQAILDSVTGIIPEEDIDLFMQKSIDYQY